MNDAIVKTLHVPLDPNAAFALFTDRIGTWWPLESHSVSAGQGAPARSVNMGQSVGSEITEITHEGARHIWGTIQEWSPGKAFATTWHPGRSETAATDLRVTFEADGTGTRITLTHSNWQALSDEAATIRGGYASGWDLVLARYQDGAL